MDFKTKKAFTLVELIVVITILAILGTIAFISLNGYSKSARDSTRISDVSNMKTSLELFHLNAGKYPLPDNNEEVIYDTDILWYQGVFGDTVISQLSRNIHEIPTDPLTEKKYIFSVINNKNEFEILSLLESDLVLNQTTAQANAATLQVTPRIDGYFNGVFIKTANYIVPVPSIITAEDISSGLTLDGTNIKSQIISGGSNIPNYGNVNYNTGGLANLNLSVYTGTVVSSDSDTKKAEIMQIIQAAYTGSELASNGKIAEILSKSSVANLAALLNVVVLKSEKISDPTPGEILTYNYEFNNINNWIHEDDINGTTLLLGNLKIIQNSTYSNDVSVGGTSWTNSYSSSYVVSRAFNNSYTSYRHAGNSEPHPIIKYDLGLGNEKIVQKYTLSQYRFQPFGPWVFQGSNDDINWDNLDTRSDIISTPQEVQASFDYEFSNSNSYRYYRFYTDSPREWTCLAEVDMFELTGASYNNTQPYYITTSDTNQLDLSGVGIITSVNIDNTEPTNTSIKALVSFDGRNTWKMWDGSSWVEKTVGTLQEGSSISQMEAGLTNYNITSEASLDFAFDLSTSDDSVTPSIDGISVSYGEGVVVEENGNDSNTVLLLHGEDFTDSSSNGYTVNMAGTVTSQSVDAKFGNAFYFGGAGNYLTVSSNDNLNFDSGTTDFTIDLWFMDGTSAGSQIISRWGGEPRWAIYYGANQNLDFYIDGSGWLDVKEGITNDIWHHLAWTYDASSTTHKIYIDGFLEYTRIQTILDGINDFSIGGNSSGWFNDGYIDELRISKGVIRWENNFTPPDQPY